MIRIRVGPRLIRSARNLGPDLRAKTEVALSAVARDFGNPHQHTGLGLRKLGRGLWECRIDIRWRLLLIQDSDGMRAFDIMDHDAVRNWLKGRKH